MPKYVSLFSWSSASWARMISNPDDRISMARQLCEALGASFESLYWLPLAPHDALVIFDGPDAITAAGVTAAVESTGAVQGIQTYELLTQEQLHQALAVATDAKKVYQPPGMRELLSPSVAPGSGDHSLSCRWPNGQRSASDHHSKVGWMPCGCPPATANGARGAGHLRVRCRAQVS